MPTIAASGVAFLASFLIGDLIPDSFGVVTQFVIGSVVGSVVFYVARAKLTEMRDG